MPFKLRPTGQPQPPPTHLQGSHDLGGNVCSLQRLSNLCIHKPGGHLVAAGAAYTAKAHLEDAAQSAGATNIAQLQGVLDATNDVPGVAAAAALD